MTTKQLWQSGLLAITMSVSALGSARAAVVTPAPFDDAAREWTLPELVDEALRRNPRTTQAWQQANALAAQLGVQRALDYPTISVGAEVGGSHVTQPAADGRHTSNQLFIGPTVQLQYLLLDFGARKAAQEQARFNLLSQNFNFNQTLQTVTLGVMNGYYNLDGAQVQLANAEAAERLADAVYRQAEVKARAGLATATDLAQARQNVEQYRYQLEGARGKVSTARVALATSLGIPGHAPLHIAAPAGLPSLAALAVRVDELIDTAFRQRPELAAKYHAWRAQLAAVDLAAANRWPALNMNVGLQRGYYATDAAAPNGVDHRDNASAVLAFSFDLFDGGQQAYQVKGAEALAAAARAALLDSQLGVIAEVVAGYVAFKTAARQVDAAQALLAAAQNSFDSTDISYRHGLKNLIDVLTAQRDLAAARATLAVARADLCNASASLSNATGSLLVGEAGVATFNPPPAGAEQ
ncbi:MAG: TolC family protein [Verrucomicrobiales bacterium]|jgi:outer membrane protein TolC|nr:TolC family protein [Verrucomicrobiales bacterium]